MPQSKLGSPPRLNRRASTKQQDASRAKSQLEAFAAERALNIAAFYVENESGASLRRPTLFELIADATAGDILLIEQVDRLSRLNESDWDALKQALSAKQIKVVALDLPTSWIMAAPVDDFTARMFSAINGIMLDMLAAISRKDYTTRRERAAQGVQKAKAAGGERQLSWPACQKAQRETYAPKCEATALGWLDAQHESPVSRSCSVAGCVCFHYARIIPSSRPRATACVLLRVPSLVLIRCRYVSIVLSATSTRAASSLFE